MHRALETSFGFTLAAAPAGLPVKAMTISRSRDSGKLAKYGLDALTAAQWSHAGRIRTEAAFAMLSGTAPPLPRACPLASAYELTNKGASDQTGSAVHHSRSRARNFVPDLQSASPGGPCRRATRQQSPICLLFIIRMA